MPKPLITLRAGTGARLRYAIGGRTFKVAAATLLTLSLAGGAVWQGPTIWDGFLDVTGLQSEEVVAEREARAVALSKLETAVEQASERKAPEKPTTEVAQAWTAFAESRKDASALLSTSDSTSAGLNNARTSLISATSALDRAIKKQQDDQAKADKEAQEKKDAEAKKKAENEKAEREAAEEAERERQRQQEQQWPQTPDPIYPPNPGNGGDGSGGGGGTGSGGGGGATASTSMSVSCPIPTTVTVTASGGGTVTISGGGQSSSGAGSASVTVTVSGSQNFSASGEGSIGMSATAC